MVLLVFIKCVKEYMALLPPTVVIVIGKAFSFLLTYLELCVYGCSDVMLVSTLPCMSLYGLFSE